MPSEAVQHLSVALVELMLPRNRNHLCDPVIAAAPAELDPQSYFLLTVLHLRGPLPVAAAAEEVGIDRSGISRYAGRMADAGWVDRKPDPADKRSSVLSLTPAGRALAKRLQAVLARHIAGIVAGWEPGAPEALGEGVARLVSDAAGT